MTERDETRQEQPSSYDVSAESTETSQDARNMAMLCHILGTTGFLGPLVIWLIERDKHHFVNEHGRETINYQISLLIYTAIASLSFVIFIGAVLMPILMLAHLILSIKGALKAKEGQPWHYPIAITFLK